MFQLRAATSVLILWASALGAYLPRATADDQGRGDGKTSVPSGEKLDDRIARLIEQLGSDDFFLRRDAERDLMRLGLDAFDALSEARNHADLEVATQAAYLARRIKVDWIRDDDPPAVKQALKDYADAAQDEQIRRAESLAGLEKDAGLAPLCRIVRYDKSPLLSKRAAILLLDAADDDGTLWKGRAETIGRELGASRRPAADWLRTRLLSLTDREAALAQWTNQIAAERASALADPDDSNNRIALGLVRSKVYLLQALGRRDEALVAIGEMIEMQEGDTESLTELVEWLAKQKAWKEVDRVAQRFGPQFERDALLLYALAEVKISAGDEAAANEIAARALALAGDDSQQHWRTGGELQERGLFRWAEAEYRQAIAGEPVTGAVRIISSYQLAELLHDQEKELPAAEVLDDVVKAMEKDVNVRGTIMQLRLQPDHMQARAEYFYASHYAQKKDYATQRKHLDNAIKVYPQDADVLIAMYRFPEADDAYRARTRQLIEKAAHSFRQEIAREPDKANNYNQFAWLIGNTEGDYDEALRFSQRSLEISPNQAGYLDTLARCYYAKGDLESAIKNQQQAVQLEPHTLIMGRQLAFFQKEQARLNQPK